MFWFLKGKKEINKIKEEVKSSFDRVKEDFNNIIKWLNHYDGKNRNLENEVIILKEKINRIETEMNELKEELVIMKDGLFKGKRTGVYKQTGVYVQTAVQTAVQTGILDKLTPSEKSIVFALLYSEMKLSYEDLAAMLGKDKSTIRGQVNSIKQKSESLIEEISEENGKKRVFIPPEKAKEIIKYIKVRVKKEKENKKVD